MDEAFLRSKARETAEALVSIYGDDREALVRAVSRVILAGLRCGVEVYLQNMKGK